MKITAKSFNCPKCGALFGADCWRERPRRVTFPSLNALRRDRPHAERVAVAREVKARIGGAK